MTCLVNLHVHFHYFMSYHSMALQLTYSSKHTKHDAKHMHLNYVYYYSQYRHIHYYLQYYTNVPS